MSDIVERLRAPAYWISGSSEGHEGDNSAPLEAANEIERLRAALRDIESECVELMRLDDGTTEETLTGYARGVYFAAKHIKNRAALEGK